jgi:predicted TIM-barrel fold metal-dependent hydrolase
MDPAITTAQLIKLLDKYNVERALVFPNPNIGDKYPEMNNYIAEGVRRHPDRLVGFGRTDPRRDPFFDRFFKKACELDLPILFHTGDGFSSPGLIMKIARKYPKQPIILGHLREGCISALKECENIYVETSGTLPDFIELSTDIDENRILFGSDIPYYRYPTQIAPVEAAKISQKAKRKVFGENFERLFGKDRIGS